MTVAEKHQLKIARRTMKLNCVGAATLGGMDHMKAREVLEKLTGKTVALSMDCDCVWRNQ